MSVKSRICLVLLFLNLCVLSNFAQDDFYDYFDSSDGKTSKKPTTYDDYHYWDTVSSTTTTDKPTVIEEECECVPYYECDAQYNKNKHKDKKNYPLGVRVTIKKVKCPHYILKCCEEEDFSTVPEPTTTSTTTTSTTTTTTSTTPTPTTSIAPQRLKGCGYRTPLSATSLKSQFGEFPWTVAIFYQNKPNEIDYICVGSLIHPKVVLTAAHCIRNFQERPFIRAGEFDSKNENEMYPHQDIQVSSMTVHARYHLRSYVNDIALLFLKEEVQLAPHINVICLPPKDLVLEKEKCFSSSWEKESFRIGSGSVLRKIELPIVNRVQCQNDLRKTKLGRRYMLHRTFVCAGGEAGEDTCSGDGGSPLVCPVSGENDRYFEYGIVSWGIGCGAKGVPGVYVNVPYFRDWIDERLKRNNIDMSPYRL